jgi:hypothetical protein
VRDAIKSKVQWGEAEAVSMRSVASKALAEGGVEASAGNVHVCLPRGVRSSCFPGYADYFRKLRKRNTGVPILATVSPFSVSE